MDITYRKVGDYYVPNIKAPEQIKEFKFEKYSALRLKYLKEHRRGEYTYLVIENITEELKEKDQMKWVGLMNNISNIADEIVIKKYVYEE